MYLRFEGFLINIGFMSFMGLFPDGENGDGGTPWVIVYFLHGSPPLEFAGEQALRFIERVNMRFPELVDPEELAAFRRKHPDIHIPTTTLPKYDMAG